jgi:hypothetical protein
MKKGRRFRADLVPFSSRSHPLMRMIRRREAANQSEATRFVSRDSLRDAVFL